MASLNNGLTRFTSIVSMAAIATLVALPGVAQVTSPGMGGDRPSTSVTPDRNTISSLDEQFVRYAYQGNNAEIITSQIALERSQSEAVRQYAERMINEHTQANQLLTEYASQRNIPFPEDTVDPLSQAIADQLNQLSDAEFDQAYMGAQTNSHLRSIALYRTQLAQGEDEGLRNYAAQLLPAIQNHYQMASQMTPDNYSAEQMRPGMDEVQPLR